MKRQIKMIGLDLDGTLLTDKKELTEYTRNVLQKAIDQGVVVLIATGRPLSGIPQELLEFPGMRYALTTNGARIVDLQTQEVICENCMEMETAGKVIDILEDYDAIREVFVDGKAYCDVDSLERIDEFFDEPYMAEYILSTREPAKQIKDRLFELAQPADKVHGIFKHLDERKEALERMKEIPGIFVTGAFFNSLEINREGTAKGLGLLMLGELLGIEREEIMACGDGMNDYDMIERVGFGVVMANGNPRLKEIADYITESNEEDGVAKAIERYVLKGE